MIGLGVGLVKKFLLGGAVGKLTDKLTGLIPTKISPLEKAQLEADILKASREFEIELLDKTNAEQQIFNDRIKDLEGTSKDLLAAGIFGKIILFARGCQRPTWGIFVLLLDWQVFSGKWSITDKEVGGADLAGVFWAINIIVLTFLFGERAIQNLSPLLEKILRK